MPSQFEDRKLQFARINQLGIFVALVFVVLLGRLWYLQIASGDDLLKQAENNRSKLLRTRAPRGTILDRKGTVLATSRPQFVVMAVPEVVEKNPDAMQTLCEILALTSDDLKAIMHAEDTRPGSPVRVAVDVPLDVVARIGELRMRLPGVSVELDQLRYYPDGPAVAHIMGQLGEISKQELDKAEQQFPDLSYQPGDYVGKAGLEKQYEEFLRGIDGGRRIEVNATGKTVGELDRQDSKPGKTVKLSIDADLQIAAARALGNRSGAVVAIDPRSGAVLAMVSAPAYDANIFTKKLKPSDWAVINDNPEKPQQNRCTNAGYAPGSTFKPLVATAGMINGLCDFTTSCPGGFSFGGHRFGCWKVHGGGVDFNRAIAESCDVWFYNLGLRLGIDRIASVTKQFGIGSKTGIDLPSEIEGLMPDSAWKQKAYRREEDKKWQPGETPSVSIGQGAVVASPLQMAVAIAAVANGGKVYEPHLLSQVIDPATGKVVEQMEPKLVRQVQATPEMFERIRQAMRLTVTHGTGGVCNMPDVTVAGKTGSAQVFGRNPNGGKPIPLPAHAWFVCFASVENPEIAIACIVEHGRHGASAAAPVCRAILDVYYGKKKASEIGEGAASVHGD